MGRKLLLIAAILGLWAAACSGGPSTVGPTEPRSGHGQMGIGGGGPAQSGLFACHAAGGGAPGYDGYGPGRLRRGGLAPEKLEPNAIVLAGHPANFHGTRRVASGQTLEMEMDDSYFSPTVLRGAPGAEVTVDLENDGGRIHNFSIPSQHIAVNCGVRAIGTVHVTLPSSGLLAFFCTYGRSSGMRGALSAGA